MKTQVLSLICFLIHTHLLTSCQQNEGDVHFINENRNVKLNFDISNISGGKVPDFNFNLINAQGLRVPLKDVVWNSTTGDLEFSITNDDFIDLETIPYPETIVSLGGNTPKISAGQFSSQVYGYSRIEAIPKKVENNHALIPYSQFILPIYKRNVLATKEKLSLAETMKFTNIGATRVKVLSAEGTPIKGASVVPYLYGEVNINGAKKPVWHSPTFRPIIEKTDDLGYALLSPLVKDSKYQIIAFADNYCSYISDEKIFSAKTITNYEIQLKKCAKATKKIEFTGEWDKEVKVFKDTKDNVSQEYAYTNQEYINIRLDSKSRELRKIKITVYEIPSDNATPCVYEGYPIEKSILTSLLSIKLPVKFMVSTCNSAEKKDIGKFQIKIESIKSASDTDANMFSYSLYGKKSTSQVAAVDAIKVKVETITGENDIISGLKTGEFYLISSIYCQDRRFIGIKVDSDPIVYSACDKDRAKFKSSDLAFLSQLTKGESLEFKLFIKDEYGNESINDTTDNLINTKTNIFVDYGLPDMTEISGQFTVKFGFAPASLTEGLPDGKMSETKTSTVILTKDTISDFTFRFADKDSCKTGGTDADGTNWPRTGASIYGFAIAETKELIDTKAFTACHKDNKVQDYQLSKNDVFFPAKAEDKAKFFIKIQDSAGHVSEAVSIDIPPCPENADTVETSPSTSVCWN